MAKGKYERWLEPDGLTLLEGWARNGLSEEQIAHNIGIRRETLIAWKKSYPNISNALKKGREISDFEVENALHKRALGYNAKIQKTFKVKEVYYDENGHRCEKEHLEVGTDEVHVAADTAAQIFWLKNRRPQVWRDKPPDAPDEHKQNNLLDAIVAGTKENIDTDGIPEIQQAADPDADLVEPAGAAEP